MQKETSLKEYGTVHNAIIQLGDTDDSGKGRHFKSRFIQPGVAGYPGQFGNVLITKESLDKFINTMVGVPVIINHKDLTADNANDERVGVVNSVWYDDKDGWYWCDGIIWDETAQNLITDKNWSVSCSYDVKTANDEGGSENNIPYDMEFLDGVFTHLALVDNPRYERANIVFNSKTFNISNFNPNHDETLTINTMHKHKNTGNPRTFADNSNPLSNASIYIINDVKQNFNPDITKHEVNNVKETEMALLDELKKLITKVENEKGDNMDDKEKQVDNEKVDKRKLIDEVGGILKGKVDDEVIRTIIGKMEKMSYDKSEAGTADNEKEDDKKEDKKDDKKVENESEKDKKEVKEIKEDVKEDVENKCKNSVDNSKPDYYNKLNEIYNAASKVQEKSDFVSRADREQAAVDYFAR